QIYDLHGKDAVKTEVLKTLDAVIERKAKGETVGLMHVVDHLANSEDPTIKSAGELLVQMVQNSILQLVFSYGDADAINLNRKVTILEIAGLDLPNEDDDPRYYSDSDRKSLSIMIGLAKFCEKFGRRSHDDPTAIIFDEAWTLTKARGGKRLVKDMKRVGRSFKNQLYLVSQNMADSETDDDKGNFGARFAFDNDVDRPDILKTMNLPQTKQNEEMLANMVKGQALFMD
ncbi:ATP-binding protein, partial [Streptomyces rubiginosohelvolus]